MFCKAVGYSCVITVEALHLLAQQCYTLTLRAGQRTINTRAVAPAACSSCCVTDTVYQTPYQALSGPECCGFLVMAPKRLLVHIQEL
jgi:hypothetical protein